MARYLKKSHPLINGSFARLGGFFMMSTSGGLKLKAVAGGPSVIKFTQSSCTGIKASGIPNAAVKKMLQRINIQVGNICQKFAFPQSKMVSFLI